VPAAGRTPATLWTHGTIVPISDGYRAALRHRFASAGVGLGVLRSGEREQPLAPGSAAESDLVERFTRAFEAKNVSSIVGLLPEDVWLTMPPLPLEWQANLPRGKRPGSGTPAHTSVRVPQAAPDVLRYPFGKLFERCVGHWVSRWVVKCVNNL
jgi:hypothetical protein